MPTWLEKRVGLDASSRHVTELEFPSSNFDDTLRGADLPDFGLFPRLSQLYMNRVNFDAAAVGKPCAAVHLRSLFLTVLDCRAGGAATSGWGRCRTWSDWIWGRCPSGTPGLLGWKHSAT